MEQRTMDRSLLNGHDPENPEWQKRMEQLVRRAKFELLFHENGSYARSSSGTEDDTSSGAPDEEESSSSSTRASPDSREQVLLVETSYADKIAPIARVDMGADRQQAMACVHGPMNKWVPTKAAMCTVYGMPGTFLPLYHYRVVCQPGAAGSFYFYKSHQRVNQPLTKGLFCWLLDYTIERLTTGCQLVQELGPALWSAIERSGLSLTEHHELLMPVIEQEWRKQCAAIRNRPPPQQSQRAKAKAGGEESEQSKAHRISVAQQLARDAGIAMVMFLTHPEVSRYFGGELMRRLTRYWPEAWLVGVRMHSRDGGPSDLQRVEDALRANPLAFCFDNTRPDVISHEHKYSGTIYPRHVGQLPCLTLPQVLAAYVDYDIDLPKPRMLFAVLMAAMLRELHYKDFHVCVTMDMLRQRAGAWMVENTGSCTVGGSTPMWYGGDRWVSKPHADEKQSPRITSINSGAGAAMHTSKPPAIPQPWLSKNFGARVLRAVGDLCSDACGGAAYCHHPTMENAALVELLCSNKATWYDMRECVVYCREAHDVEGMLVHAVHRVCVQAEIMAKAEGPMRLKMLPKGTQCCSEQYAAARYAVGYSPDGKHTNPCEPIVNKQGSGGAGKTAEINLLSMMLPPRSLLVIAFQGSHVNVVNRRYPHVRVATLLRMLHRHEFMCGRGCAAQAARMANSGEFNMSHKSAAGISEMRKRMLEKLQLDMETWEKKVHGTARQGEPEPEAFNYGYPFVNCPLEEVEVLVLEEFGMAPWSSIALLLSILVQCAPRLRCIITMGDVHQLYPISPGHIQKSFIDAFGSIAFNHSHRTGEGVLKQLGLAARDRRSDLVRFDNETACFVECHQNSIVDQLRELTRRYGLTPENSQMITRTNKWRTEINRGLKDLYYPGAESLVLMNEQAARTGGNTRNSNALDAREKFVYKLNRPSLGVCNNGLYTVCFRALVDILFDESESMGYDADTKYTTGADVVQRASNAACINETELVPAQAAFAAGLGIQETAEMLYGADGQPPLLDACMPADFAPVLVPGVLDPRQLRLPDVCFSRRPQLLPYQIRTPIMLPMPPSAVALMLADEHGSAPDMRSHSFRIQLREVHASTYVGYEESRRLRQRKKDESVPVIVCREFYDGMDPDAPVDQEKLIYLPYGTPQRRLFQPALCITGHCMQGNQSGCVILVLPYVCKYDTCNYAYMAVTRAMANADNEDDDEDYVGRRRTKRPSLIVVGRMSDFLRMISEFQEPERSSCTGRILRHVRDCTRKHLSEMDYTVAAELERQENGCFGVREKPFSELLAEQKTRPALPAALAIAIAIATDDFDDLLDDELATLDMAALTSLGKRKEREEEDVEQPTVKQQCTEEAAADTQPPLLGKRKEHPIEWPTQEPVVVDSVDEAALVQKRQRADKLKSTYDFDVEELESMVQLKKHPPIEDHPLVQQ